MTDTEAIALWLSVLALLLIVGNSPLFSDTTCTTDTECMQMHGGDGGPAPQG
jgi:hypothetical protein